MRRLLSVLFMISDLTAGLLLWASLAVAGLYPFAGPAYAKMANLPLPMERIVFVVGIAILLALAAFLLSRRKLFGVLLLLMTGIGWIPAGQYMTALFQCLIILAIFGVPLLLSYLESQRGRGNRLNL